MKGWLILIGAAVLGWWIWKRNQKPQTLSYAAFIRQQRNEPVGDFNTDFWQNIFNGTNTPKNVMDKLTSPPAVDILNPADRMAIV